MNAKNKWLLKAKWKEIVKKGFVMKSVNAGCRSRTKKTFDHRGKVL